MGPEERDKLAILLVEDSRTYAEIIKQRLERLRRFNFQVTIVHSLKDAIARLNAEDFDAVVSDLGLPDSQGIDTFRQLVSHTTDAPVLILTMSDDNAQALKILHAGAQDYLVKGELSVESLVRSLLYAIERYRVEKVNMRLSVIEDFMSTLAHDLQVPLLGQERVIEALLNEKIGDLSKEQKKIVSELKDSNQSVLDMLGRLLKTYKYEFSSEKLSFQKIDLKALLAETLETFGEAIDRCNLVIDKRIGNDDFEILGDKVALRTLFENLIDNAIKFSPAGGVISIQALKNNGNVAVEISDQGEGIADEDKQMLFKRFWQGIPGKKYVAGTGLGLYQSQKIARAHNGRVSLGNREAGGCTLVVRLPLHNAVGSDDTGR